jgi:hypothetical protein
MTHDVEGSRVRPGAPDQVDRILVIACVALWLTALGAAVAAVVALVDLASAHTAGSGGSDTPWLLYSVIGVSAAVIVGAIPLLLRARQSASSGAAYRPSAHDDGGSAAAATSQPRLEPFGAPVLRRTSTPPAGSRVGFPVAAVDQIWLRGTASIGCAMGAAMTAIGIATYLMASGHDTASWMLYGVAGLLTVAMPAAPVYFLRELREIIDANA